MLRLAALPPQLHILIQYRTAASASSSTIHRLPFPTYPRPTPHQIFHLPYGSSQGDIKARYYDLVRIYHPDSPHCRNLSPEERHSRFQTIAAAYDVLRGKGSFEGGRPYRHPSDDPFEAELMRRRNAFWAHPSRQPGYAEHFAQRRAKDTWSSKREDSMKDSIIIIFGVLSLVAGILPGFIAFPAHLDEKNKEAAANLKQARSDAREIGDTRMAEIRRRVQEIKSQGT